MPKLSNGKNKKQTMSSEYSFEELDRDLLNLDEFLKASNIKVKDRLKLYEPLLSKIPKQFTGVSHQSLQPNHTYWLKRLAFVLAFLILGIIVMKQWDRIHWNLTAIVRICMIKILPYYDWRPLKNEICLIPNFLLPDKTFPKTKEMFDCELCESLTGIDYFTVEDESVLPDYIKKYAEVNRPLLVSGAIEPWLKETPDIFIRQMINNDVFSKSIPCNLHTNIHNSMKSDATLLDLFDKKIFFDSFFIHFQNCDLDAMKVFRSYTYRPAILPEEISPVTYNWLLWNRNYNTTNYKKIDLIEKYTGIGQLFGKTKFRLAPRKNCETDCPVLDQTLNSGEFLIFTSLWDFEYLPEGEDDNVAVIVELKD